MFSPRRIEKFLDSGPQMNFLLRRLKKQADRFLKKQGFSVRH